MGGSTPPLATGGGGKAAGAAGGEGRGATVGTAGGGGGGGVWWRSSGGADFQVGLAKWLGSGDGDGRCVYAYEGVYAGLIPVPTTVGTAEGFESNTTGFA